MTHARLRNVLHETIRKRFESPMKYTAGQAAKASGVSTATITRALKSGRISGIKDDGGAWVIDPSELHRVFRPVATQEPERAPVQNDATEINTSETRALEREINTLREALEDARYDRDKWRDMAERLSLAPPAPKPLSEPEPGLWGRLFGKK